MQNLQLPSFFLMSNTGEAQGDSLAQIFPSKRSLESWRSITSFSSKLVRGGGCFTGQLLPVSIEWVARSVQPTLPLALTKQSLYLSNNWTASDNWGRVRWVTPSPTSADRTLLKCSGNRCRISPCRFWVCLTGVITSPGATWDGETASIPSFPLRAFRSASLQHDIADTRIIAIYQQVSHFWFMKAGVAAIIQNCDA